ncbi:P-loop containing nucleoside triphosphate hydrolase protein [Clohesyomyces aquaticus]|uniref:p-loop containing nucleoside triphosphate hydrolase protein n=1 Tax=Clohesyomyces aquaticus TaxID=1231657 RepID=A0A1Y1ZWU2_9PLEO|nr:P-loop containing nucleoside triphosphate hydrolase protein [Clohesyomyces aquaticus]
MTAPPGAPQWELDVYATPFVPDAFRAINSERAAVIPTQTQHRILFSEYTETFVARHFRPPSASARPAPAGGVNGSQPEPRLSAASYLDFWHRVHEAEISAKEVENDAYALYNVPLVPTEAYDGQQQLYRLLVPGLREETPFVELGDTIQLRQLHVDPFNNLILMPVQFGPHSPPTLFTWGGVQYDATVEDINRAFELVFLKVEGLVPQCMRFNVTYAIRHRLVGAQGKALQRVSHDLSKIARHELASEMTKLVHDAANVALRNGDNANHTNGVNGTTSPKPGDIPNDWIRRMLFPIDLDGFMQTQLDSLPRRGLFDGKLNYEQIVAVDNVCRNHYGVLPYLISGPPGTGKTKTLVELAMQLINSEIDHILICAPSESAADTLALRLSKRLNTSQLFRLNAAGRTESEVPAPLRKYCYRETRGDQLVYYLPPFPQLMKYLIVVTSTRNASILMEARVTNADLYTIEGTMLSAFHPESATPPPTPSLHWGALLIDEAAQATELESLFPLAVVMPPPSYPPSSPQPRFAMAGDENQLGPRTASRNPHLTTSLFARLFARDIYASHPLSRSNVRPSTSAPVLTAAMLPMPYPPFENLTRNYRSHPAILSVPSSLFYNDTLIPEATFPPSKLSTSPLWLPPNTNTRHNPPWPVRFLPHRGADDIERDGGGWFNPSEARFACSLVQTLVSASGIPERDIIIMSPFAAQVKYLRREIRSQRYGGGKGLYDVNIGPLEAFQGLEGRVVVVCTTRSRTRYVESDGKRGIGVVGTDARDGMEGDGGSMRKRMNMAITRAKEGLVVIGHPEVLALDPWWREWVGFCVRNGLVDLNELGDDVKYFREGRVGVLEKALLNQEESMRERIEGEGRRGRVLGGAVLGQGVEDEMWIAGLRDAIEGLGDDEEEEEDGEDDELDADEDEEAAVGYRE